MNTPPVADLSSNLTQGEVPFAVQFAVNGTDDDHDTLTWMLSVAPADDATNQTLIAEGGAVPAVVNHTFGSVGDFTVRLELSDGTNVSVSEVVIGVIEAAPAFPSAVTISDSGTDGGATFTEITSVDLEVTADAVLMTMHLNAVDAGVGDSPFTYQLHINGLVLENYVLLGNGLWDNTNGQEADGSASRDPAAGTASISVTRAYLDGVGIFEPYALSTSSYIGEGQAGGIQQVDRAPDAGEVVLIGPDHQP